MENYKRVSRNNNNPDLQSDVPNSNNYLDDIEASLNNINHEFFNSEAPTETFIQPTTRSNASNTTGLSLKEILESKSSKHVAPRPQPEAPSRRHAKSVPNAYDNTYDDTPSYKRSSQSEHANSTSYRDNAIEDRQPMKRGSAPEHVNPSNPWLAVQENLDRDENDMNGYDYNEEQGNAFSRSRKQHSQDFVEPPRTSRSFREQMPFDHDEQHHTTDRNFDSPASRRPNNSRSNSNHKEYVSQAVEQDDIDDLLNKIRNHNLKQGTRTDADTRMAILRKMAATGDEPDSLDFEAVPSKRHNKALEELVDSIERDVELSQPALREMEYTQERMMFGDSVRGEIQRQNNQQSINTPQEMPSRNKADELPVLQVGLDSKEAHAMVDTLNLTNLALVEKTQELSVQLHEYEEDLEYMEGNLQRTNRLIVVLLVLFVLLIIILGVYTFKTLL